MKYLLLFIIIAFYSCNDTSFVSDNPQEDTTIQIQELAAQDSTTYKIIQIPESTNYYCVDTRTNLVVYKMINATGIVFTLLLIMAIIAVLFFIVGIIAEA